MKKKTKIIIAVVCVVIVAVIAAAEIANQIQVKNSRYYYYTADIGNITYTPVERDNLYNIPIKFSEIKNDIDSPVDTKIRSTSFDENDKIYKSKSYPYPQFVILQENNKYFYMYIDHFPKQTDIKTVIETFKLTSDDLIELVRVETYGKGETRITDSKQMKTIYSQMRDSILVDEAKKTQLKNLNAENDGYIKFYIKGSPLPFIINTYLYDGKPYLYVGSDNYYETDLNIFQ